MTIYRMYADSGHRAGFWVQHPGWRNTCARVQSVGGRWAGRPAADARSRDAAAANTGPQVDPDDDDAVFVRWFDVRSGREIDDDPRLPNPGDKHFAFIAEPAWYRRTMPAGGTN